MQFSTEITSNQMFPVDNIVSPGIFFFITVMNPRYFPTIVAAPSVAHYNIFCIGISFSSQNLSTALKTIVVRESAGRLTAKIMSF